MVNKPIEPGDTFGRLTVVGRAGYDSSKKPLWECKCSCGGTAKTRASRLKSGNTRSCGCLVKENAAERGRNSRIEIAPGTVFGQLTVLGLAGSDKQRVSMSHCKCSCGKEKKVRNVSLSKGKTKSCGCAHIREIEPGTIFGRLTVLSYAGVSKNKSVSNCKCSCGEEKIVRNADLLNGVSQSCGCLHKEELVERNTTHGMSKDIAYKRAATSTYRAVKKQAIPAWDRELTDLVTLEAHDKARFLTDELGIPFEVDHIVPLKGKDGATHVVCGLHVYNNLQVIPASENRSKNCYNWPNK